MSILTDSIKSCIAEFYSAMSTPVIFRKMSKLTGPNPAINPVDGAIAVSVSALSGATIITLTAPVGNWFLRSGDKFTISGDPTVYTVSAQKASSSGLFSSVSFTPSLSANAVAGTSVSFSWSNDYNVSAVISPYDDDMIDGTTISVKDWRCYLQAVDNNGVFYPIPTNLDKISIAGEPFRPIGITATVQSGEFGFVHDVQARG